jgi:hypothetical protein
MIRIPALGLLVLAPSAGVAQPQRQPQPIEVQWKELPRVVMGRRVAAVLADGTHVEGKVRRINPAELVLDITKTSAPHAYPKGVSAIPCEAVSTLQVKQRRWRIAGTLIGLGGGLAAGWIPALLLCGSPDSGNACTWSAWLAITGISAIVGYVAGRSPDRRAGRVGRVTCGGAAPAADGTLSEVSEAGKLDWRSRCGQNDLGEEHCY